jgi:hypothetical protein
MPGAMNSRPSIIERALQLAKSGQYATVQDIRAQLILENYASVDALIRGNTLVAQLRGRISAARTED